MSATAIPKTSSERPPFIGGPPIRTAFDGSPPEEPDPQINRLAESVERLVKTVDHTPADRLDVLLRLLQQRKRWVEEELHVERLLNTASLPPFDYFSLEQALEPQTKDENRYVQLLNLLEDVIFRVTFRMRALNGQADTSQS